MGSGSRLSTVFEKSPLRSAAVGQCAATRSRCARGPLVGNHEERVVRIADDVRDQNRAGHVEAELVAAQDRFVRPVLGDFVRHASSMSFRKFSYTRPCHDGLGLTFGWPAGCRGACPVAGDRLEFLGGTSQRIRRSRRVCALGGPASNQNGYNQDCTCQHVKSEAIVSEAARRAARDRAP